MSEWRFYDPATGVIHSRKVVCPSGQVVANSPHGHLPIPGDFDHLSQRVDITAKAPDQPLRDELGSPIPWFPPVVDYQPPAPAADELRTWAWDGAARRWVPVPTLLALKRARLAELRLAAMADDDADITLQGSTFAADGAARDALMREALIAQMAIADGQAFSLTWERVDDSAVTLNAAQLKAVVRAIRQRSNDIRATLRARRAALDAATTAEQVAAVTWA